MFKIANNLNTNPWFLDTQATLTTNQTRIKGIRWFGGTTAGHLCELTDNDDVTIWKAFATGVNNNDAQILEFTANGVKLADLDSGEVVVYLV